MKSMNIGMSAAALFLAAACGGSQQSRNTMPAMSDGKSAAGDEVKCMGINECKGHGSCAVTGGSSCAGQNECKGKGWVKASAADCTAKGGKVI
jgi:hypothetical protein